MKALKETTRLALEEHGHDVIFEVKFDWLRNNWKNVVEGYDKWIQCYEKIICYEGEITGSSLTSIEDSLANWQTDIHRDKYIYITGGNGGGQIRVIDQNSSNILTIGTPWESVPAAGSTYQIIELVGLNTTGVCKVGAEYDEAYYVAFGRDNKGEGSVESVDVKYSGEHDTWTLLCVDKESGRFVVYGEINKVQEDAYVGNAYNNGFISFIIQESSKYPFEQGDIITIYPAVVVENDVGYVTNSIGSSEGFIVDGGPDFLSWSKVEWIGDNLEVMVRTSTEVPGGSYSEWVSVNSGDALENMLSPRRYLQFIVKLNGSGYQAAKLAQLSFSYTVKVHTNTSRSEGYYEGFNRIKSIRLDKSATPYQQEGYAIADGSITVINEDSYFSPDNVESPYYGFLDTDIRIQVNIGINEEFFKKFHGIIDQFNLNAGDTTVSLRFKDLGKLFNKKTIVDDDISYRTWKNVRFKFLCQILAIDCKFSLYDLNIFNAISSSYVFDYVNLKGKNAWTTLQQLAQATLSNIYLSDEGKLVLRDMFFSKNMVSSPDSSFHNGDFTTFVYNSMYNSFLYLCFYKYETSMLYYYYSKYVPLIQNVYAASVMYFDKNESGETITSFWAVDKHNLYRIEPNQDTPRFEKKLTVLGHSFTNIMFSSSLSVEEVGTDAEEYTEKLFALLREESDEDNYFLYMIAYDFNLYREFILGNMGKHTITEGSKLYYSYYLPVAAYSADRTSVFMISVGGTEEEIPFDDESPYSQSPSSWRFENDERKAIIINKELPGAVFKALYAPEVPLDIVNAEIKIDDRFKRDVYENVDPNLFLCDFIGIIEYKTDLTHHGHIFYLTNDVTGSPTYVRTTSGYRATLPADMDKIVGCVYDVYRKVFVILYKNSSGYKIYWVSLLNVADNGEEVFLVEGRVDPDLILYKIQYNKIDRQVYITGGYEGGEDRVAKLFTYSTGVVRCEFENLAGKPLINVYSKDPHDMASVQDKEYYFYFQKRGGFRAITSQIWAWSRYIRDSEDKDKCVLRQNVVDSTTSADGVVKEFTVPIQIAVDDIQYVYVDGTDIGSINWVKGQTAIILQYPPELNSVVQFGDGKKLYKYYGVFATFDVTASVNNTWDHPPWSTFQIYKPVKLRLTFRNCSIGVGDTLLLYGINEKNGDTTETVTFNGSTYTCSATGGGVSTRDFIQDDNGDYYIETISFFKRVSWIDASLIWADNSSQMQMESILMDLIDGVYIEIYTTVDDEDQFGGDGSISGYTDKVYINVIKDSGVDEVNRFTDELAFMGMDITSKGIIAGMTYPKGEVFFYTHVKDQIPIIPDYALEYDRNIQSFSLAIADSSVKNKIVIQAMRKETEEFRETDIEDGTSIGGGTLPTGYTEDSWLWAKLHTAWRNQSPYYLGKGRFIEFNISFQTPVDNGGQLTNIRFNAKYSSFLGRLDSNGHWQVNDVENYFPNLRLDNTKMILMAGKGDGGGSLFWDYAASYNGDPIYRIFTPWDTTVYTIPAIFPTNLGSFVDLSSVPDLSGGIDVPVGNKLIRAVVDGVDRIVDITSQAAASEEGGVIHVYAQEIVEAINVIFSGYGSIASVKIDYSGINEQVYVQIKSFLKDSKSKIYFADPGESMATTQAIFGPNYPTSSSPRNAINSTMGEMEIQNCEVYIEEELHKCDYSAGEYTIYKEGVGDNAVYVLELSQLVREKYAGKLVSFYYPLRLNATQLDIDQSYGRGVYDEGIGSIRRFYYDEGSLQPRELRSYDFLGNKYTLAYPIGGFHLNMLWDNSAVLESTSYLRIENPTDNELDANFNPEGDPSRLDVWVEKIELRGLRIYDAPMEVTSIEDKQSQEKYQKQEWSISNDFIQDADIAFTVGSYLLKKYRKPLNVGDIGILGVSTLELLDIVAVREKNSALSGKLFEVVSINESLQDSAAYTMTLQLHKLPDEYQPKPTTKFLYYSVIKFGKEII